MRKRNTIPKSPVINLLTALLILISGSVIAQVDATPVKLNPDGYGPSMVENFRIGTRDYFITPGTNATGESVYYYSNSSLDGFFEVSDDVSTKYLPAITYSREKIEVDGFMNKYYIDDLNSGIYSFNAGNDNPFFTKVWSYTGTGSFKIESDLIRKDNRDYFLAKLNTDNGYTHNVYSYNNGLTNVTQYEIPETVGIGAVAFSALFSTRDALYIQMHDDILNESYFLYIKNGVATAVKVNGVEEWYFEAWMGYTIDNSNTEQVFVIGTEYVNNIGQKALYRINGSSATKVSDWVGYGAVPDFRGKFNGLSYCTVAAESNNYQDVLITIAPTGEINEIPWPIVNDAPIEARPIYGDKNGVWFLDDYSNLWVRNNNEWINIGITTYDILPLGDSYYIAGSKIVYEEDLTGVLMPKTQNGIYKVSMGMLGSPETELYWHARFEYNHTVGGLTYYEGNLYFGIDQMGTYYLPFDGDTTDPGGNTGGGTNYTADTDIGQGYFYEYNQGVVDSTLIMKDSVLFTANMDTLRKVKYFYDETEQVFMPVEEANYAYDQQLRLINRTNCSIYEGLDSGGVVTVKDCMTNTYFYDESTGLLDSTVSCFSDEYGQCTGDFDKASKLYYENNLLFKTVNFYNYHPDIIEDSSLYFYENDLLIEEVDIVSNDGNAYKSTFHYNQDARIDSVYYYSKRLDRDVWKVDNLDIYSYQNNTIKVEKLKFNYTSNNWEWESEIDSVFTENGQLKLLVYYQLGFNEISNQEELKPYEKVFWEIQRIESPNNLPVINEQTFSVNEGISFGDYVATVAGSDQDGDTVTFSITGGNIDGAFVINSSTGELTVNNSAALDFETTPTFALTVEVSDGNGGVGGATVTINLNDVVEGGNTAPAVADQMFSIDENTSYGTVVGSVVATDPDTDVLTYSIAAGNSSGGFALNSSTGEITANNSAALDYETTPAFDLTIEVNDGNGGVSTATITVNLNDLGEGVNAVPAVADQSFTVDENAAYGTAIGTVLATDTDGDVLGYTILSGNTNGGFAINSSTGEITANNSVAIDYETTPVFSLSIEVNDGNGGVQTAKVTIHVNGDAVGTVSSLFEAHGKVYPNPFTGAVNYELSKGLVGGTVEVISLQGIKVAEFKLEGATGFIDLGAYPSGVYTAIIRKDGGLYYLRLSKID